MSGFGRNSRKTKYLANLPTSIVETCGLARKSKFNFSYFSSSQAHSSDFVDLELSGLSEFCDKLKQYSEFPLSHWLHQRVGSGKQNVLEIYGSFPSKSEFTHPKHVPSDVRWARFRLEQKARLVGFVVPADLVNKPSSDREFYFCGNTFYVVFIDLEHKFYISPK